jgi:putative membrane protein
MILLADSIMPGFQVNGFWWALLFSLLLSLVNTLLTDLSGSNQK